MPERVEQVKGLILDEKKSPIKFSLMTDKDYSDEQIVFIVQRQERSIDETAILEVWRNWGDWSAYLKDFVNQRIQSGSQMPDEVRQARSYAARLGDWERKNEQWLCFSSAMK